MQFRLTYDGLLYSTANDSTMKGDKRADHKHKLRMEFHPQLKRLWEITPFLKNAEAGGPNYLLLSGDASGEPAPNYKPSYLAKKHSMDNWRFVPLVSEELKLLCSIEVLMLRPSIPGKVIKSGDIDGRLKTLFDALSKPNEHQGYVNRDLGVGENPTYILLENDRLVTKVSVETDQLLQINPAAEFDNNFVRLLLTVKLRPFEMNSGNMQFG